MVKIAEKYKSSDLENFLKDYHYQPELTKKLDKLKKYKRLTPSIINKIVLWKVNRYAQLPSTVLKALNKRKLMTLKNGQHEKGRAVLKLLLDKDTKGVDLPMASTFLRFRNPKVFQIIDSRAYRAVYGIKYPKMTKIDEKIKTYFKYLGKLNGLHRKKKVNFKTIDRLLYVLDKEKNGKL